MWSTGGRIRDRTVIWRLHSSRSHAWRSLKRLELTRRLAMAVCSGQDIIITGTERAVGEFVGQMRAGFWRSLLTVENVLGGKGIQLWKSCCWNNCPRWCWRYRMGCFSNGCKLPLQIINGTSNGRKYRDDILGGHIDHNSIIMLLLTDQCSKTKMLDPIEPVLRENHWNTSMVSHVTGYISDWTFVGLHRTLNK